MSSVYLPGYGDEVTKFVKAFGVDTSNVHFFELSIHPDEAVTITVGYFVTEDQLNEATLIAEKLTQDYKLVAVGDPIPVETPVETKIYDIIQKKQLGALQSIVNALKGKKEGK